VKSDLRVKRPSGQSNLERLSVTTLSKSFLVEGEKVHLWAGNFHRVQVGRIASWSNCKFVELILGLLGVV
jgi:hypothetical protein